MILIIEDQKTGGAQPFDATPEVTDGYLVIHWGDIDFKMPVEEIRIVMMEDDGK